VFAIILGSCFVKEEAGAKPFKRLSVLTLIRGRGIRDGGLLSNFR
jgi:hypothetical protein